MGWYSAEGRFSLPRVHLQEMLEVIESFSTKVTLRSHATKQNAQARGLGVYGGISGETDEECMPQG